MEQSKVSLKVRKPAPKYSEAFKRQVVREFEQGFLNKDQLQVKYGIGGNSRLLAWCRKYGKFDYQTTTTPNGRPMKDPQKRRIKELEKQLKEAREKLLVYGALIEVTNSQLDQDTIKKIEAKLQESLQQKKH